MSLSPQTTAYTPPRQWKRGEVMGLVKLALQTIEPDKEITHTNVRDRLCLIHSGDIPCLKLISNAMMLMYVRGQLEISHKIRGGYVYKRIVPPKEKIVPEIPPYVPYPGPFEFLAPGLVSTVMLPTQAEMEALEIPEDLKRRMFLTYKPKEETPVVPPAPVIVPYVGEMPPSKAAPPHEPRDMPDMVRAAILYMRQLYPFVTTVFYSRDRQWIFTGDDMRVAEIMDKIVEGLDLDLLKSASEQACGPVAYRIPLNPGRES